MKKKIVAVCATVALAAVALGGATLAYFTDTDDQTNTFTAGKVGISLDEAVVEGDENGNLVQKYKGNEPVRTSDDQSYKLYPGMTVAKDPTIALDEGSEDSYVAAKITIKGDLLDLYGADTAKPKTYYNLDITKFVSGGLIAAGSTQGFGWNGLSMIYTDAAGNVYYQDADNGGKGAGSEWVVYVFIKDVKKAGDVIKLFETITVDGSYGNLEMAKLNDSEITVEAFAVQAHGFTTSATDATDCFNAMTEAFPTEFDF